MIAKTDNKLVFNIYRKTTVSDTIVNYKSCHPTEHNHSATKFLTEFLHTYPLSCDDKKKELHIIEDILLET
jgi:hypothetical protein